MRNAGSSIMMYDIIILENFRFRPPARSQEASVFKNLHSGQRFRKHGFSVAVFTGNVWTAGHWRKKISVSSHKIRIRVGGRGLKIEGQAFLW